MVVIIPGLEFDDPIMAHHIKWNDASAIMTELKRPVIDDEMGLGFAGLGFLPLPEVTAIGYAAPLLTVVFAAMFLGENVRLFRMSAVALGLAGVLIVL